MLSAGSFAVQEHVSMLVGDGGAIKRVDCSMAAPPEQAKIKVAIAKRYKISVVLSAWRREGDGWFCTVIQQTVGK